MQSGKNIVEMKTSKTAGKSFHHTDKESSEFYQKYLGTKYVK